MTTLLLAEDDRQLGLTLKSQLKADGYQVELVAGVSAAFNLIDQQFFDVTIIDRGLEDGDGLEIIEYLNLYSYQTKILVLSLKKETKQIETGLKAGADDYLGKPFSMNELLLRLNNLKHREKITPLDSIDFGLGQFFPISGIVQLSQGVIRLTEREAAVFKILLLNQGRVMSKQMIRDRAWPEIDDQPCLNTIEVYVLRLRTKLKQYDHASLIKTIRGFGYCFNSAVDSR